MDVSGNVDAENRNIEMHHKHGRINQQWDLVYVDEHPGEPTKGQLNKEFNLYVERDFHIVSQMKSHRYIEVINNRNLVIKTPNGNKGQVWYFDQTSKTIKTRINNQSIDIANKGATTAMQIWSTNSGWW
jgi:hypothetical protein